MYINRVVYAVYCLCLNILSPRDTDRYSSKLYNTGDYRYLAAITTTASFKLTCPAIKMGNSVPNLNKPSPG